jgi:hypothetical protein
MKFRILFPGPEEVLQVRRDFLMALRLGLEKNGHDVSFETKQFDPGRFTLIVGGYFLRADVQRKVAESGNPYAVINTEVIAKDMLNHRPDKTDFTGAYLPMMRAGKFVWDVIMDNLAEHKRYGIAAHFWRWGHLDELADVPQARDKDLDFYFFGMASPRRQQIMQRLAQAGFKGRYDHACQYFIRNDLIGRAKVQLNMIQADHFTHVNSFRICYLANNRTAILSEKETDPAGYLDYARVASADQFKDALADLIRGDAWKKLAEQSHEKFRLQPMKELTERLLDESFGGARAAA